MTEADDSHEPFNPEDPFTPEEVDFLLNDPSVPEEVVEYMRHVLDWPGGDQGFMEFHKLVKDDLRDELKRLSPEAGLEAEVADLMNEVEDSEVAKRIDGLTGKDAREAARDEALYQMARLNELKAGGDDLTRDEWRRRGQASE